jgi:xyloglucan fucosyltransferase
VYVAMNLVMKRIIAMRNPRADNEDGNNKFSDLETTVTDKYATTSSPLTLMRLMGFFVISFMLFSVFFSLSVVLRDPPSDAAISSTTTLFQQHTQSQQQGFFLISFSQFNLSNFINNILDRINIVVHYK